MKGGSPFTFLSPPLKVMLLAHSLPSLYTFSFGIALFRSLLNFKFYSHGARGRGLPCSSSILTYHPLCLSHACVSLYFLVPLVRTYFR